jgi:hypothetical protein
MARWVAVVGVWVALGCAELEPTTAGMCGNGVLDPSTEDCDGRVESALGARASCGSPGDGSRACRLVCDAAEECPSGWGCAPGGYCHFPSGKFEPGGAAETPGNDWALSDVDGDGVLDLASLHRGELSVSWGNGRGGFETGASEPVIETPFGRAAFGDIDADGFGDVAVPSPGGLLVFTGSGDRREPFTVLAPYALTNQLPAVDARVYAIRAGEGLEDGAAAVILTESSSATDVSAWVVQRPWKRGADPPMELPIAGWSSLSTVEGVVADIDGDGADEVVLVRAYARDEPAALVVLTTRPKLWTQDPYVEPSVPRALPPLEPGVRPVVVHIDADAFRDLLIPLADGGARLLRGSSAGFEGELEAFSLRYVEDGRDALADEFPLAVYDLDRDGILDWILPSGIAIGLEFDDPTQRSVRRIEVAGQGAAWRAAAVLETRGAALPTLAVIGGTHPDALTLFRIRCEPSANDPVCPNPRLTADQVPVQGSPRELRVGDFDGDGSDDLAFIDATDDDYVRIQFSEGARPFERRTMLRLPRGTRLDAGLFASAEVVDGAADLLIATPSAGGVGVGLLPGNASRAAHLPIRLGEYWNVSEAGIDVVVGRFDGDPTDGADGIAAVSHAAKVYRLIAPVLPEQAEPSLVAKPPNTLLCTHESGASMGAALWTKVSGEGGRDDLVGIAPRQGCHGAEAARMLLVFRSELGSLQERPVRGLGVPRAVVAMDVDQDGHMDLIVADAATVHVLFGPEFVSRVPPFEQPMVHGLAAVQADRDAPPELAVLTSTELVIIDPATGRILSTLDVGGTTLAVADVNGDGLDDLLVGDGQRVQVWLAISHVHTQGDRR